MVWPARAALLLGLAVAAGGAGAQERLSGCADPALEPAQTRDLCERALRDPRLGPATRARVLVNLGVALAALDRQGDALRVFTLAVAADPDLVAARVNRARSLAALGRAEEARAAYDAAIEQAPGDAAPWAGRGALRLRLGDAPGAIDDLSRAIRRDRADTSAFFNRGLAYLEAGQPREAVADFSEVIRRVPEDAAAHLYRAEARANARDARAGEDYDRAIALAPDWARAHALRGRFREAQGRTAEAERDFLRAYELGLDARWLVERVQRIGGG